MMEDLLAKVQRPSRYLGNEKNVPEKDWTACRLRWVLAFPDVYEVGMSHLGVLLLYDTLNQHDWLGAERVFAPWPDMEMHLRLQKNPLLSLESRTPLAHFDIVGFSLQYELSYTNVLTMLELGGIPLLAADRGRDMPLVIGGGPCCFNPEPLAPFFDAFVLGDGEELVLMISETVASWKKRQQTRPDLLQELSALEGVYVPEFFQPHYDDKGRIAVIEPRLPGKTTVRKAILPTLEMSQPPRCPLVPATRIVHDRLRVEVVRGCTRGCRFCQAGFVYRPVRERSPRQVLDLVNQGLAASGYDELSLLALSIGDYSCIRDLLRALMCLNRNQRVAVSLPSLRVGTLDETMIREISRVRKTGFTLAPEAGSERLRRVINKGITERDLLNTVQAVYTAGWPLIKLYFMMGLPTESAEDREALMELALNIWREAARHKPRRRLHVSVSTFVPKAHTPFQWESQLGLDDMNTHLDSFKRRLGKRGLNFKWHQPFQSMLEGVFARGDRRLAAVLIGAQQSGCRFDGWSEQLRPDLWRETFAKTGVNPSFYCERQRGPREVLPWSHLDCGVSPDYLWKEYERALAEASTPDCRFEGCVNCGVCDHKRIGPQLCQGGGEPVFVQAEQHTSAVDGLHRYRLMYVKMGSARFYSHLELIPVFQRAARRAGLPLAYSEGHHPTPRISLGDALPLGIETRGEEMAMTLQQPLEPTEISTRLNAELPSGLRVRPAPGEGAHHLKTGPRLVIYEATLPGRTWPSEGFSRLLQSELPPLAQRSKSGERLIPLEGRVLDIQALSLETLRVTLKQDSIVNIRVRELLAHVFGLSSEELMGARIIRISSHTMEG